jgi:hypothetical protein
MRQSLKAQYFVLSLYCRDHFYWIEVILYTNTTSTYCFSIKLKILVKNAATVREIVNLMLHIFSAICSYYYQMFSFTN